MVPKTLVEEELDAILASPAFHGSRRCSDFLRLTVRSKLEGHSEDIKERTIATDIFGRDTSYDPKTDAVVRVNANDVRKRLAQYYQTAGSRANVRISLPPGGYVPAFELIEPATTPAPVAPAGPAQGLPSRRTMLLAAAGGATIFLSFLIFRIASFNPAVSDAEAFWQPYLVASKPVVVCIAPSIQVRLADPSKVMARVKVQPGRHQYEIPLEPGLDIGSKVIYDFENHMAIGDAFALAAVFHRLGEMGKPAILKSGQEVSFPDMKGSPAVLIGAFNNQWAMELNSDLQFSFKDGAILDRQTGRRYQMRTDNGRHLEDYGLVSRLLNSKTGGPALTIGGVGQYGTQAAAEIITVPEQMKQLIRALPSGWRTHSLQIIVKTVLVQERPGPAEIVAVHAL